LSEAQGRVAGAPQGAVGVVRTRATSRCRARALARILTACVTPITLLVATGCITPGPETTTVEPMRASEMLDDADPARRASTRLVIEGLDADQAFDRRHARGSYERAIQVDPTNPMAYLALARHELDDLEARRALQLLEQAAALFEAEGLRIDAVGVHVNGLRGRAYEALGEDGGALLEQAAALAPEVWGDGFLAPEELR
jgi:tetratricopeptide (TPR) repeat protein